VIDVLKVPEELLDPIADGAAPMRSVRRGHRDCQSTLGFLRSRSFILLQFELTFSAEPW
jgi:hypothetical protein